MISPPYLLLRGRCQWCGAWPCICTARRLEHCACGGWIAAGPEDVAARVTEHNETAQHRAWRERLS